MEHTVLWCQLWIHLFRVPPGGTTFAGSLQVSACTNSGTLEALDQKTRCWYSGTCLFEGLGSRCQRGGFFCGSQQRSKSQVCEAFEFGPRGQLWLRRASNMSRSEKSCRPCHIQNIQDHFPQVFIWRSDLHQICRSFKWEGWCKLFSSCLNFIL